MQLDDAVGTQTGAIAGHRVADAVDRRIGPRGLRRVAEVAERESAALGQPPELVVAGLQLAVEVGRQHVVARADRERARRGARASGDVRQLAAGLRRAEAVDDDQRRQVAEELLLQAGAQRRTAGQQHGERRQVVRRGARARRAAAGRTRRRRSAGS